MSNFQACLGFTLLPNNDGQALHTTQNDPGGATNEGVTWHSYCLYCASLGKTATMADFAKLTPLLVQPIYALGYWNPIAGNALPNGVDCMVFDFGVTSGPGTSAKLLQEAAGLHGNDVDGWIGPQTIKAVAALNPFTVITSLMGLQGGYYRSLSGFAQFGNGWLNRTYRRRAASVAMVTGPYAPPVPAPPPAVTADALNAQQLAKDTP